MGRLQLRIVVAGDCVRTVKRLNAERFKARLTHCFNVSVDAPNIRRAVMPGMHLILSVGAESVELNCSPTHAAAARGVSQMRVINRVWNRRNAQVLFERTRRY